jgi:thiosulfate dehydrogenase [quinone] large subunit
MFAPSTSAANVSTTTSTTATTSTTTTAPADSTTTVPASTTTAAPPSGTVIGSTSAVPVGGSAAFTDPKTGDPGLVIQQPADTFRAFDAICPHAGCTVAYQPSAKVIVCPCHGSEFNAKTGAVEVGPATTGLTPIKVVRGPNGDLYAI